MGVRRCLLGALLLAGLALSAPATALADATLQPRGALVYTWHGEPGRGCARLGVCGVTGTLIVRPQDGVDAARVDGSIIFELGGLTATVRVRRSDPGSQGTCVDTGASTNLVSAIDATLGRSGTLRASVDGPPSSGRCAGPTASDLSHVVLHGRYTTGRTSHYNLRTVAPFTAGPYSGTLLSTLQLGPYTGPAGSLFSGGGDSTSSGGGSSSGGGPGKGYQIEQLELDYRLRLAPATLSVGFSGAADPLCNPFDACGARGDLVLATPSRTVTVSVMALRRAPRRVGRAEALRAFAAGRFTLEPGASALLPARLSETFARAGAPATCADGHQTHLALMLGDFLGSSRKVVPLTLDAFGSLQSTAVDVLRTHCPGPESADVLAPLDVLGKVMLPRRALTGHISRFAVPMRGSFSGGGYTGSRTGAIDAALTLKRVTVSTYTQYGSPGFGP